MKLERMNFKYKIQEFLIYINNIVILHKCQNLMEILLQSVLKQIYLHNGVVAYNVN